MMFIEMRVMRGPNMWSRDHSNVIAIKFDPLSISEVDDHQQKIGIDYFHENYAINALHEDFHLCVYEYILQLAAKLQEQELYHELIYPTPGILYGVLQYKTEEVGIKALELASGIVESLLASEKPVNFDFALDEIRAVKSEYRKEATTSIIIEAAKKRNIPVSDGPAGFTILGYGKYQKRFSGAMSDQTSSIAVNIAADKKSTKQFLENSNLPVPKWELVEDENDLMKIADELEYPLVTKPLDGNLVQNVTGNITNFENLLTGFRYANEISKSVLVEKEIQGQEYQLLVVGNKFVAASLRLPAKIEGDGFSTVLELVEQKNKQVENANENTSAKIELDAETELSLQKQGFSLSSIPEREQHVFLKLTSNINTGGTSEDVTELAHPANKSLAEKVSRVIGLDICGIDIISSDISESIVENGGAIIEVNANPNLRIHQNPTKGESREVGEPIVKLMFPKGENGRIPIIAVTGTNGKTTTTRLMAHVLSFVGHNVGFSSTDGIYINTEKVESGDCSGPQSAQAILQDSTVDYAVLECARGGIIRSGLGFDQCDIAIVTNVAADHLGIKDVHSVADLAFVKVVVPSSVKKDGWAILNAGDHYAHSMKDKIKCKVALFCADEKNEHLQQHLKSGGYGIYANSQQDIFIFDGEREIFVFNAVEVPITRNGKAGFMVENILPVILAAYLSDISLDEISLALKGFIPSADLTPGRINEFEINGVNVILDYAHNPHGLNALAGYLKNIPGRKLGIITGTGDRREEDIIEFGRIAAAMFADIIIRFDRDLRGRTKESIVELLARGMYEINPKQEYQVIPDTQTAIHFAISTAEKGSYVVICADNATYTLGLTREVALQFQNQL